MAREYLVDRDLIKTLTDTETGGRPRTLEVATEALEATKPHPSGDRSHSSLMAQSETGWARTGQREV